MNVLRRIWNHKQKIAGTVTGVVSILGGAKIITPEMALHITAVSGALTMLFALLVDIAQADADDK